MAQRRQVRRRVKRTRPSVRRAPSSSAAGARTEAKQSMGGDGGLMIGGVHDPAEKQADRMADRVMRMPSPGPMVQRECKSCEGENNKVRAKPAPRSAPTAPGASAAPASPGAAGAIKSMGSGMPLAKADRAFFEPRFGADLSGVRVHDGAPADKASRGINARAFTHGNDVAFAKGEYQPGTKAGRHLMAHELSHVVGEQGAARRQVRRLGDTSQIPSGMSCPVPDSSMSLHSVSNIKFRVGGATLTQSARGELSTVAAGFHAMGGSLNMRVDGFASTDGPDSLNWTISCRRAEAVRNELARPSDGSAGIPVAKLSVFAQGETSEFSRSLGPNRAATVRSDAPFAPISCQFGIAETRGSACIQPVLIADDDGSSPTTAPSFTAVRDIWSRCCVDITVASAITVSGTRFKDIDNAENLVPTIEEKDMINDAGAGTNCVPVFVVDTISLSGVSGKNVSGGGYTLTSGLPGPHIVVVDGGSSWLVAHELGHGFDVDHGLGTRADGQPTIAQPTGSFNGAGSEKVSDPICAASRGSAPVTVTGGTPNCCKDLS